MAGKSTAGKSVASDRAARAGSPAVSAGAPVDVVLVQMPFGNLFWPSIGLSLLKAGLDREGLESEVLYFTFPFAEAIGVHTYLRIADGLRPPTSDLVGEWLFAGALHGDGPRAPLEAGGLDPAEYVEEVLRPRTREADRDRRTTDAFVRKVLAARARIDGFLDRAVERVVARAPRVVGLTSLFQQHTAALALAKRLRTRLPGATLVLGGSNCEGPMGEETLRRFPFLDAVVSGEGDLVFPDLVRRALSGEGSPGFVTGTPVRELDALPVPDYADFFAAFRASRFARRWEPGILLETSRGCWWGERQHCTFCGLNGATMAYRSKSAARALGELEALVTAHPRAQVAVVDNILDLAYFKDFLPALRDRKLGVSLFYETKSNLRKEQVRLLRDAGITRFQPGIESLSDPVLGLMRKGVSALQNLQLLRWSAELGVRPVWNFLWGFPGEPPEEYARMAALVPLLVHLEPPWGAFPIRLDRFSPNFDQAEAMGFRDVAPFPAYRHVYPFGAEAVRRLAYFFTYAYREERDVAAYVAPLAAAVHRWRRLHARSALFFADLGADLAAGLAADPGAARTFVADLRPGARVPLLALDGIDRRVFLACDDGRTAEAVGQRVAGERPEAVEAALGRLVGAGLLAVLGKRYLGLAVPLGEWRPAADVARRFHTIARALGRVVGDEVVVPVAAEGRGVRVPVGGSPGAPRTLALEHLRLGPGGELLIATRAASAARKRAPDGRSSPRAIGVAR